jgi:hypothetical protein
MSLLNDALKRARDANERGRGGGPILPPLQPADSPARPAGGPRVVLAVLLVVTIGSSAFFLHRWSKSPGTTPVGESVDGATALRPQHLSADAPTPTGGAEATPVAPPGPDRVERTTDAPNTARSPEVAAVLPAEGPAAAATTPGSSNALTSALPAAAEAAPPPLRLQSIIFRLRNPSALINGVMVGVGDSVQGARVVKIDRHAVTLEGKGQTNVLELPRL